MLTGKPREELSAKVIREEIEAATKEFRADRNDAAKKRRASITLYGADSDPAKTYADLIGKITAKHRDRMRPLNALLKVLEAEEEGKKEGDDDSKT